MPRYSYWASAYGHLASYLVMLALSVFLGARYNPFPYKWGRILMIFLIMGVIYGLASAADAMLFPTGGSAAVQAGFNWGKIALHTVLLLAYLGLCTMLLRPAWRRAREAA